MCHAINSHVLTGINLCLNQAIHVLLMHTTFFFLYIYAFWYGHKNLTSSTVTCIDIFREKFLNFGLSFSNIHRNAIVLYDQVSSISFILDRVDEFKD